MVKNPLLYNADIDRGLLAIVLGSDFLNIHAEMVLL
jgi:hypothetical protein